MKKALLYFGVVAILVAATFFFERMRKPAPSQTLSTADPLIHERTSLPMSAPSPSRPPAAPLATSLAPEAQTAIRTLEEILTSRNDNDPRLDTHFRGLSVVTKAALRQKYAQLPVEDRNGRGTVVFLLGREIKDAADLDFFREVMNEPPCLSLTDCSKDTQVARGGDGHGEMGIESTLAYPQIVNLVSLERLISGAGADGLSPALRDAAWKIIEAAKNSPIPIVAKRAADLERKLRG